MNKIKQIREIRGLSIKEAAKRIGITGSMLGLLEKGQRTLTEKYIKDLSNILNCSKAQLLGDESIDEELGKVYPLKEKYIEVAVEIVNKITEPEDLTKKGRGKILTDVYKLVHDFYELPAGKKEFFDFIKTEMNKLDDK